MDAGSRFFDPSFEELLFCPQVSHDPHFFGRSSTRTQSTRQQFFGIFRPFASLRRPKSIRRDLHAIFTMPGEFLFTFCYKTIFGLSSGHVDWPLSNMTIDEKTPKIIRLLSWLKKRVSKIFFLNVYDNLLNFRHCMDSMPGPATKIQTYHVTSFNNSLSRQIDQQNKVFKTVKDFVDEFSEDESKKRYISKVNKFQRWFYALFRCW